MPEKAATVRSIGSLTKEPNFPKPLAIDCAVAPRGQETLNEVLVVRLGTPSAVSTTVELTDAAVTAMFGILAASFPTPKSEAYSPPRATMFSKHIRRSLKVMNGPARVRLSRAESHG